MENSERIGESSIPKLLVEFSIPAIVGMMVSALYNVIDRIFIGNSMGALGLAGITIGFPIMIIQMAFGALIGMGATAQISIKLGQGRGEEAQKIVGNAVVLLGIVTFLLTSLGLIFLNPLLKVFGASNEVLPYARSYMQIILAGTVFQTFSYGLNNMIRGEGKPRIAMATMLIGTVLNAILAPIFIFIFHWGMRGAAIATVLSQMVSSVWILFHFIWGNSSLKILPQNLKLQGVLVRQILLLGVPQFAMQFTGSIVTALMNKSLEIYGGDLAISAMGIVNSISTLVFLPVVGINQGAQPIIGYNYGAQKYERVMKTLKFGILIASAITVLGFLVVQMFPSQIISIFNRQDKSLIALGSHALRIYFFFYVFVGFQIVGSGYFQAVGKPKQAMILSFSRQLIILIPALFILPLFFKLDGVFMTGPAEDSLSSVITGIWLMMELKANRKRVAEQNP